MILEAARSAGCTTVLTEDLQHGMDFDGVIIENPFLGDR
jgi:predicted nucleic acid-binding protein